MITPTPGNREEIPPPSLAPATNSSASQASKVATALFNAGSSMWNWLEKAGNAFYMRKTEQNPQTYSEFEQEQLAEEFFCIPKSDQVGPDTVVTLPEVLKEWISLDELRSLPFPVQSAILNQSYGLVEVLQARVPFKIFASLELDTITNILNHASAMKELIVDILSTQVEACEFDFDKTTWIKVLKVSSAAISNMNNGSLNINEVQQLIQEHFSREGAFERPRGAYISNGSKNENG